MGIVSSALVCFLMPEQNIGGGSIITKKRFILAYRLSVSLGIGNLWDGTEPSGEKGTVGWIQQQCVWGSRREEVA